jgi:DNA polymerase alpha subunit B
MLDLSYSKLGEWWNVRPDVLITPSLLPPFVKVFPLCFSLSFSFSILTLIVQVVNSVLVINPGTLSKRRAAGTYAQISIHPRVIADDEREQKQLSHKLYERARVDVIRI